MNDCRSSAVKPQAHPSIGRQHVGQGPRPPPLHQQRNPHVSVERIRKHVPSPNACPLSTFGQVTAPENTVFPVVGYVESFAYPSFVGIERKNPLPLPPPLPKALESMFWPKGLRPVCTWPRDNPKLGPQQHQGASPTHQSNQRKPNNKSKPQRHPFGGGGGSWCLSANGSQKNPANSHPPPSSKLRQCPTLIRSLSLLYLGHGRGLRATHTTTNTGFKKRGLHGELVQERGI